MVGEVKGVDSRAGGVGGRTVATICSQFRKLHYKTPRGDRCGPVRRCCPRRSREQTETKCGIRPCNTGLGKRNDESYH